MNNSTTALRDLPKRPWQVLVVTFTLLLVFFQIAFLLPDIIRCEGGDGFGCLALVGLVPALVVFLYSLAYMTWSVFYGEKRGLTLTTICYIIIFWIFEVVSAFAGNQIADYTIKIVLIPMIVPALFLSLYLRRHPFYNISPRATISKHSLRETLLVALSKDRFLGEIFEVRDVVFLILLSTPALVGVVTGFVLLNDVDYQKLGRMAIDISLLLEIFIFLLFFIGGKKLIKNILTVLTVLVLLGFAPMPIFFLLEMIQ